MVEISSSLFLASTLASTRFLRIGNRECPCSLLPDRSLGRDEEERLEGGVGLNVEVLGVTKQPGTLGVEQRARLLLREELGR